MPTASATTRRGATDGAPSASTPPPDGLDERPVRTALPHRVRGDDRRAAGMGHVAVDDQKRPVRHRRLGRPRQFRAPVRRSDLPPRSEEHTSELQSLMRTSYAVFCLKKKTQTSRESVTIR